MGVGGWLMSAGRVWELGRALFWQVRCGAVPRGYVTPAAGFLCDLGQFAMQTRSSAFQSYMCKTQEHLQHENA